MRTAGAPSVSIHFPQVISPQVVSPQVISPQVISPQVIFPQVISPQVISPQVIFPQVIFPQAAAPLRPVFLLLSGVGRVCQRQLEPPFPVPPVVGIGDGRRRGDRRDLADADSASGHIQARLLHHDGLDLLLRQLVGAEQPQRTVLGGGFTALPTSWAATILLIFPVSRSRMHIWVA